VQTPFCDAAIAKIHRFVVALPNNVFELKMLLLAVVSTCWSHLQVSLFIRKL
jgi:hypothetical protein